MFIRNMGLKKDFFRKENKSFQIVKVVDKIISLKLIFLFLLFFNIQSQK